MSKKPKKPAPAPARRQCGDCTACCSALGVPELAKKPGDPCSNICASRCAIYADRPASCRAFECLWLKGLGTGRDRPDLSGVVLSSGTGDFPELGQVVTAFPATAGSLDTLRAGLFLDSIAAHLLVVLVYPDGRRRFVGPPAQLSAAKAKIAELAKKGGGHA